MALPEIGSFVHRFPSWNSGELYCAPRDSVEDLLETDACSKYGVYLLLASDKVYVGQSSDLARRLTQHMSGKDWWESAVILTTKDDSLNHADIDYLESVLIEKAQLTGRLDCDNGNKGMPRKVGRFREVFLAQYLEEALFLMQLIGITVFSRDCAGGESGSVPEKTFVIDATDPSMRLRFGTRAKSDAMRFAEAHGVELCDNVSYSTLQSNGVEFWLNPQSSCLDGDWSIILNDTQAGQLIILRVPAHSLTIASGSGLGLAVRSDKPELLDLHISLDRLIDRASKTNFSTFEAGRLSY